MYKQGITIIEVIVIVMILIVIAALILPNMMSSTGWGHNKSQDISNLKNLVGIYISGQTANKKVPKSRGHEFWLALFVGDPKSMKDGLDIWNAYAQPSQAGNLICLMDKGVLSKDEIAQEFEDLVMNEVQGWDSLSHDSSSYTSYAGPKNPDYFSQKMIVGCTGSRDGIGFFSQGFAVVYGDQSAQFLKYEDLADSNSQEWTGDEVEPNWKSVTLLTVLNLKSSSQSDLQTSSKN